MPVFQWSGARLRETKRGELPNILYVMGTGRSGTTILEVLLANNPGIVGVGEFKHFLRHGFIENRLCSCGKAARECDVWESVFRECGWAQEEWEHKAKIVEVMERHARFPMLWLGLGDKQNFAAYRNAQESLFTLISERTGSATIVDSSKYETRGLMLAKLFPGKVKVLFVTRSARSLIDAFGKWDAQEQIRGKSAVAVAIYYMYVLFCMLLVRVKLGGDCLSIRFEDLQRRPTAVLNKIEAWSGYCLTNSKRKIQEGDWFEVGHILSGNRLRKERKVKFKADSSISSLAEKTRGIAGALEAYRSFLGF